MCVCVCACTMTDIVFFRFHPNCEPLKLATEKYEYSGQNIAVFGRTSGYGESNATIDRIFKLWFNEYKLADMSYIERFHSSK